MPFSQGNMYYEVELFRRLTQEPEVIIDIRYMLDPNHGLELVERNLYPRINRRCLDDGSAPAIGEISYVTDGEIVVPYTITTNQLNTLLRNRRHLYPHIPRKLFEVAFSLVTDEIPSMHKHTAIQGRHLVLPASAIGRSELSNK